MSLSEKMLRYRAKNKCTQAQAAEQAGISLMTWNFVEREMQVPSAVTKKKIELLVGEDDGSEYQ